MLNKSFNTECVQWIQVDIGGYKSSWAFAASYEPKAEFNEF